MNVEPGTSVALIAQPQAQALALPVEGFIVEATLHLERVRTQAESALGHLRFMPRDEVAMWAILTGLQTNLNGAIDSYNAYWQVRSCAGQA